MRKFIFLFMLLLQGIMLFSQTQEHPTLTKADYLKKSKNQKKAANILLFGGGGLVITAFAFPRGKAESPPPGSFIYFVNYKNDGIKAVFLLTGALSMLSSIPLYIASARNNRKARAITVSMQNQELLFPERSTLILKSQPAVTLKLSL